MQELFILLFCECEYCFTHFFFFYPVKLTTAAQSIHLRLQFFSGKIVYLYYCRKHIYMFGFFQPFQRIENEVELLGEHLPVGGFTYPPSAHPPTLPPSAPLQFLTHDPLHQEVSFGVVSIVLPATFSVILLAVLHSDMQYILSKTCSSCSCSLLMTTAAYCSPFYFS